TRGRAAVAADAEPAPEPDGPPVAARQAGGLRQPAIRVDRGGGPALPVVPGEPPAGGRALQGRGPVGRLLARPVTVKRLKVTHLDDDEQRDRRLLPMREAPDG